MNKPALGSPDNLCYIFNSCPVYEHSNVGLTLRFVYEVISSTVNYPVRSGFFNEIFGLFRVGDIKRIDISKNEMVPVKVL